MRPPPLTFNARNSSHRYYYSNEAHYYSSGPTNGQLRPAFFFFFFKPDVIMVTKWNCHAVVATTHIHTAHPPGWIHWCVFMAHHPADPTVSQPSTGGRLFSLTVPTLEEWFITTERKRNPRGFSRVYIQGGYLYNGQIIPCVTDGTTRKRNIFGI